MDVWSIVSWIAVVMLASSYWFQIWKIHVHKEVRDLSIAFYAFLTIGFSILSVTAYHEGSTIFLIKNIITAIPASIILCQIFYHKDDQWLPVESVFFVVELSPLSHRVVHIYKTHKEAKAKLAELNSQLFDSKNTSTHYTVFEKQIDTCEV